MRAIDFTLPVRFAADCPACVSCGEPWCPVHDMHYAECPCPGPMSDPDDDEEEDKDR